ncbi:MAG: alpha-amylase family glycosyl hydrolase [bacterium]|nr:alpha-amylase family glycosyl hydrolase [bacterium]
MAMVQDNLRWWDREVGYEVYIRSFADGNGDGVGDFPGLAEKLDYLAWLGVGIVWVTPFYPSPMADFGYDVADYTGVDPLFGTLDDFDTCIAEAHRLGLRVLIDLVPNHTSDQHQWFQASRSDPDSPMRGYYHWRDPARGGGPPNNWVSHFGGPAWTYDEASEQYYLHLFLPEQPDLNWSNPNVMREFDDVLRFWLERGADGFRIDVAHGLVKNMLMPDNPQRYPVTPEMGPRQVFDSYEHRYDLDQAGNTAIYRRWRDIVEPYDALLLGEVYLRDNNPSRASRYVANQDGLHRAFYFSPMHTPWEPSAMWSTFGDALAAAPRDFSWAVSSHDDPRAPTRLGGGELGQSRALAYCVLMFALPGLPFLYQGDELGLADVDVPLDRCQDPVAVRNRNPSNGRDGCRTPMPWVPGPEAGFTDGAEPWLPVGRNDSDTAAVQRDDPQAILHKYRELLALRRELHDLHAGGLEWLTDRTSPVIGFRRGDTVCALNAGDVPVDFQLPPGQWRLAFSSQQPPGAVAASAVSLDAPEGVLLARVPDSA